MPLAADATAASHSGSCPRPRRFERIALHTEKAFATGFNVLRVNQRNCGGTEHLTPTLYESGLSRDYRAILKELIEKDGLPEIFFAGYSMGGNLVMKMTGEFGARPPRELLGVCAVCPSLDLGASSKASDETRNLLYKWHFLWCFKRRMRRKAGLFPKLHCAVGLWHLRSIREWHEAITAPACGYCDAADYYYRASALRVVDHIRVPTLILASQDDPIIPFATFRDAGIVGNPFITLVTPGHGGHCGFVSRNGGDERFWAEQRVIEFCAQHLRISKARQSKAEGKVLSLCIKNGERLMSSTEGRELAIGSTSKWVRPLDLNQRVRVFHEISFYCSSACYILAAGKSGNGNA